MYKITLDGNNYVLHVSLIPESSMENLDGPFIDSIDIFDLSDYRINAHYWNGTTLIFDEDKYKAIEDSLNKRKEFDEIRLRIDELNSKLSDTTYVVIKILEGAATQDEYVDVLRNRMLWWAEKDRLEKILAEYYPPDSNI